MSHFMVMVIGENIDDQLAPYQEDLGNPNSKWDWFEIGGRYECRLIKFDGTRCTRCAVREINWKAMSADKRDAFERQWAHYSEEKNSIGLDFIYGIKKDDTRETYMTRCATPFAPFAVVKDGQWFERGTMGWWARVKNKKNDEQWEAEFHSLVRSLPPSTTVTLVDCHI